MADRSKINDKRLAEPNIDRLIAAFRREKLDRVPNFEDIVMQPMCRHVLGKPVDGCNRQLPPDDAIEFVRRTSQDAVMLAGDAWPYVEGDFCDWADIDRFTPPDPAEMRRHVLPYCEAVKDTNIGVGLNLVGPFFTTYMEVGPIQIQSFMLKLYDDLPFIERLMDRQLEMQMKIVEAVLDLPIDFFILADDTCDNWGFMCSPQIMQQIWVPRITKLIELVKQKGAPIQWHCCGNLHQVLPMLVDWGIDCVNPVQTACNDIYALKEQYGGRISFRGNMNIEGALAFGTPEEVRAETRECIERLSHDGGYIVASSHSIIESIPPENYFAMIETAREFGRY